MSFVRIAGLLTVLSSSIIATASCGLSSGGLLDDSDIRPPLLDAGAHVITADAASAIDAEAADATDASVSPSAIEAASPAPFCESSAALLACFRFEGTATDESPAAHQPATATKVSFVAGHEGLAARFNQESTIDLPSAPDWNVAAVTVEMWFRLALLPDDGKRMGLFDSDGRYGVFVYPDGVRCLMPDVVSIGVVPVGVWTHIACVHDGTHVIAYKNGVAVASLPATTPPAQSSLAIAIGANSPSGDGLDGWIDNLRVWSVGRSAAEITAAAQR